MSYSFDPRSELPLVLGGNVFGWSADRAQSFAVLDAFVDGMGSKAESVLSAYLDRASTRLVALVTTQQRRFAHKPKYENIVEIVPVGGHDRGAANRNQ